MSRLFVPIVLLVMGCEVEHNELDNAENARVIGGSCQAQLGACLLGEFQPTPGDDCFSLTDRCRDRCMQQCRDNFPEPEDPETSKLDDFFDACVDERC